DVLMTADNEADFGRPGIQYVHYPKLDPVRPEVDLRWYHGSRAVMALYYRAGRRLGGISDDGVRRNLTLANSAFIAARIRAPHGIEAVVLHPPVPGDFPAVPWEAREDGFVALGRISPEKRLEDVIEILRRVRARAEAVRLHLVGTDDDPGYTARIRRLVAADAAWIPLHANLARPDLGARRAILGRALRRTDARDRASVVTGGGRSDPCGSTRRSSRRTRPPSRPGLAK